MLALVGHYVHEDVRGTVERRLAVHAHLARRQEDGVIRRIELRAHVVSHAASIDVEVLL